MEPVARVGVAGLSADEGAGGSQNHHYTGHNTGSSYENDAAKRAFAPAPKTPETQADETSKASESTIWLLVVLLLALRKRCV
jgi:hypothetical protein